MMASPLINFAAKPLFYYYYDREGYEAKFKQSRSNVNIGSTTMKSVNSGDNF